MNKECCEKCYPYKGQPEWDMCLDRNCKCHPDKGEKKCICYGDMDEGHRKTCPLFTAPTQPESSWDKEYSETVEVVYQQGRRDAMEELEGKLPKADTSLPSDSVMTRVFTDGFNSCHTTVLNIIKSIKGE